MIGIRQTPISIFKIKLVHLKIRKLRDRAVKFVMSHRMRRAFARCSLQIKVDDMKIWWVSEIQDLFVKIKE